MKTSEVLRATGLFAVVCVCLIQPSEPPDARRIPGANQDTRSLYSSRPGPVSVVVEASRHERGPAKCPSRLAPWLTRLTHVDPAVRREARTRLAAINWRHLSWLRPEARRGSAERRLALGWVVRRLCDRRYEGKPPEPIDPR